MDNRMGEHIALDNLFGTYLKDRRTRLDPAAFGFPGERRRTPGLRREEVAQRANISPTWYTWLEQGRGGGRRAPGRRPRPYRPRPDADRHQARAPVPARPRPPAGGALPQERRRHAPAPA